MKENNTTQIKEARLVSELNARNKSGLSFLQAVYNDDGLDEGTRMNSNKTDVQFNGDNSAMSGTKNILTPDMTGMHGQVVYDNKLMKDKLKIAETKAKHINGTVETVVKGDQLIQGVPNTHTAHSSAVMFDKPKSLYSQAPSVAQMSSPPLKYSVAPKNSSVSVQSHSNATNPFTPAAVKSFAQSVTTPQARRLSGLAKTALSSSSCIVNDDISSDSVKSVDSSRQTAIIDRDTAEVLLIMNPTSPVSNHSRSSKPSLGDSPAEQQNIFIDEDSNYGNVVGSSDRQLGKTAPSPSSSRPVLSSTHDRGCHPSSPGRRSVSEYSSHAAPGSSSPTLTGPSTPAVFRFNERVSSSGRTIAPPKRYLDDDEAMYAKKRRDKPGQGKPRNVLR